MGLQTGYIVMESMDMRWIIVSLPPGVAIEACDMGCVCNFCFLTTLHAHVAQYILTWATVPPAYSETYSMHHPIFVHFPPSPALLFPPLFLSCPLIPLFHHRHTEARCSPPAIKNEATKGKNKTRLCIGGPRVQVQLDGQLFFSAS